MVFTGFKGHADGFYNNTCTFVTRPDWTPAYAEYYCNTTYNGQQYALPTMHNNTVWEVVGATHNGTGVRYVNAIFRNLQFF